MYVLHPCKKFKENRRGDGLFLCVCHESYTQHLNATATCLAAYSKTQFAHSATLQYAPFCWKWKRFSRMFRSIFSELITTSVRKLKYSSRSCCLRAKLGKALHMHGLWQQWMLPTGVRPAIRSLIHWQRCITKNTFSSGRTWISGLHEVTVSYCLAYPCSFECFTSSFRGGKLNRVKWLASKFRKHVSVEKHRCEQ